MALLPPPQANQPPNDDNPQAQAQLAPAQINAMALSFRPSTFNGLHPECANSWWHSFNWYAELTGLQGNARCNLLSLVLSGSAKIWFNSLPDQTRADFEALEAAFREKYITAVHTQLQDQMAVLSRSQCPSEIMDEYITDAHSKMVDYKYDNALQITLLISGLRPEIKMSVLQHLPFDDIEALTTLSLPLKRKVYSPSHVASQY